MSNKTEIIQELNAHQEEQLEAYFEKWLKIGLRFGATTDFNRKMSEEAIIEIYSRSGLARPKIIWAKSPDEAIKMAFDMGDKNIKNNPMGDAGFGQHDANWLGFYDFFMNEVGLKEETEELLPTMKLAEHCGWWWPYENACILSEIPINISLDDSGGLHNETGPAIEYSDGFCVYALRGISVPDWSIETPKDKIDHKKILALTATEQRMVLMKYIGLAQFLDALGANLIDENGEDRLYYLTVEGNKIGPYLRLICPSTGREFLEGVGDADKYEFLDPTIKTCEQAHYWRKMKASNGHMTKVAKKQLFHS